MSFPNIKFSVLVMVSLILFGETTSKVVSDTVGKTRPRDTEYPLWDDKPRPTVSVPNSLPSSRRNYSLNNFALVLDSSSRQISDRSLVQATVKQRVGKDRKNHLFDKHYVNTVDKQSGTLERSGKERDRSGTMVLTRPKRQIAVRQSKRRSQKSAPGTNYRKRPIVNLLDTARLGEIDNVFDGASSAEERKQRELPQSAG